jgi:hypothetical protein
MWFATYLHRNGLVTAEQIVEAAQRQISDRAPIGRLALESKKMTMSQVAKVLSIQANEQKAFGRIALENGFLSEADLAYLLMLQSDRTKPIAEYLIEMGAIDRDVMQDGSAKARRAAVDGADQLCVLKLAT